jgi:tetratricopeptide (TPR) repeat protein
VARAAAKRNKRAGQVARPRPAPAAASVKRDKTLEDQLFFGRLRGHAKWAFVFLALVFAVGFVVLGVGSGTNSGLSDVFNSIFGGSSGPSITKLQDKVAKNPKDAASLLQLGQALAGKQRLDEAIVAYERYVGLRPKSVQGLSALAALYEQKAQVDAAIVQDAQSQAQAASPDSLLGPGLGGGQNSISSATSTAAQQQFQTALSRYQQTLQALLNVYKELARLQPDEPSALLKVAETTGLAGDIRGSIAEYKRFLERFPNDPLAPDVRKQVKDLQKSLKGSG